MLPSDQPTLKKALNALHIWALAVGLVISGEYFGWNYGWGVAGTVGFLLATLLVTVLYVTFIFSFTELTASIPNAGGPFAYACKALGPYGGVVAGYVTLIEFVFAPPAIAFALGAYVHFLYPGIATLDCAVACYLLFTGINLLGIKESAAFNLFVTVLAVAELLLFMGIVAPHFEMKRFLANPVPLEPGRIFAAIPFAIWLYLGIEGVAMVAEEAKDPQRTIPRGYLWGILTLVALALGVMVLSGGVGDWRALSKMDYPLPETIATVLGHGNVFTKLFAGIGLFGLIASFHGLIIGYSRQIFALSRSGFLPAVLSRVNRRFQTPHWALVSGGLVGILTLYTGTTGQVITLSALGAVSMYIISMVSLLKMGRREAPVFKTPFYPWFPRIALGLSVLCLLAMLWYNQALGAGFFGCLLLALVLFRVLGGTRRYRIDL
jgi:ethanolamine permease